MRNVMMRHAAAIGGTVLLLAGCATEPRKPVAQVPITPPAERATAPVVRTPVEPVQIARAPEAAASAPADSIAAALPFAADVIYMCITQQGGQRKQTAIEFAPKVLALCRKHPEMGPCQYERNVCRSAGGRVFAADGSEITRATETEYDKRVLRVRFRGD